MSAPKETEDFIQRRKDNNLCISCGNPIDGIGSMCTECNNKKKKADRNHGYYIKARENNICWVCGNKKDRDGYYCSKCLIKKREDSKEQKIFYRSIGICPLCKKNRLFGSEKTCPECRAKESERIYRIRERDREKYNKEHNLCEKRIYSERLKNGLCPRCGKIQTDKRYKLCSYCRNKKAKNSEKNRAKSESKTERRVREGKCIWCENPKKEGYKLCEYHYKMNVEKSKKADRGKIKESINNLFTNK